MSRIPRIHAPLAPAVAATLCLVMLGGADAAAQGNRAVGLGPAAEVPRTLKAAAPVDLTGTWVSVVTEDWRWRMMTPPRGDYAAVPLTAEGRQVADNWDPAADEAAGLQCKTYGAAAVMRMPGRVTLSWADDNTLKVETDAGTQTRLLRYGAGAASSGSNGSGSNGSGSNSAERSWQGQSTAYWELPPGAGPAAPPPGVAPGAAGEGEGGRRGAARGSGSLHVTTTNLRAGYLRKNGVPYSENATMTEYFVRTIAPDGDDWLVVTTIVTEPKYLNEPFVTSSHFKKEPNNSKFTPTPCVVPRESGEVR